MIVQTTPDDKIFNPNLGGGNFNPPVGFPFCILYSPQSPDAGQNSNGVISDFRIFDQSLIKRNCLNS